MGYRSNIILAGTADFQPPLVAFFCFTTAGDRCWQVGMGVAGAGIDEYSAINHGCAEFWKGSVSMAVITVSPATDISALIASDNVSPGDVLVLEDGEYFQTVNVTKDYLRLVAKGTKAVFDGKSILAAAFILNDVTGVEVNGVSIMHYRVNGIRIERGGGHRIVGNKINRVLVYGINVTFSRENLIWKNEICHAVDGVLLGGSSVNNHILENLATLCEDDGFESFSQTDSNNVFAGNVAINNGGFGLEVWGNNNLMLNNVLVSNRLGGINVSNGSNSIAIGNLVKNSGSRGCFANLFFGENNVEGNLREGITVLGTFPNGIFHRNTVRYNTDSAITLGADTRSNFVFDNVFKCNIPFNIRDLSDNNNYFGNIDEPCKPNELPFEDCGGCLKGFKERRTADGSQ